jgi:hypothetical protein
MPRIGDDERARAIATRPDLQTWTTLLLDSYRHWIGAELIERSTPAADAAELFEAARVVLSHGAGPDPILNYGNRAALALWGTHWDAFTRMPSRLTAEPAERAARSAAFETVRAHGYVEGYRGIRVTTHGRRFLIEAATVWTIVDASGPARGHAATFPRWTYID